MGFFSNLRSATTVTLATQFVRKHLELQRDLGRFHGDVGDTADKLVLALWSDIPGLKEQREKPSAVLVAAASLSNGAKHFDSVGNRALGDTMIGALKTLLQYEVHKLVNLERLSPIDSQLWDLAHAPFD